MLRTLYGKLACALIVVLSAVGVLCALVSMTGMQDHHEEITQRLNRGLAKNLVAERDLISGGKLDPKAVKRTFEMYMTINPSIEIYLLDHTGSILSYSADPERVKRTQVSLEPIRAFLRGDDRFLVLGDDPRNPKGRKAFSVTEIPAANQPPGFLYVVLQGQEFDAVAASLYERYFLRLGLWAIVPSLAVGLLFGLAVFRVLTRRLHSLAAAVDQFNLTGTALSPRDLASGARDELDRLGATFERMAQRIAQQVDELKRNDHLRRQLVAHLSHDLRTPLASMRGYLESLKMRSGTLRESEREEYLEIALDNAEQLTQRVNQLFELATLNAQDIDPRKEPFGPAELVQDVVQKFELRALAQNIGLRMQHPVEIPRVEADIGLTERVLENLIENALTHTPSGGQVVVSLSIAGPEVCIEVADTGPGIAADEVDAIFEPFQRGTQPARKGSHAGLGLAIAQRIVELHGAELTVETQLGAGARFRFSVPAMV